MQRTLILIRGLPGSGKSSFGEHCADRMIAADDYFMVDGEYKFDPSKLPQAHAMCQQTARDLLSSSDTTVVANTFSCRWEMEPYFEIARTLEVRVFVIDMFDGGLTDEELEERNVHGVPLAGIKAMRERWEHEWKMGDPRPPWERG